MLLAAPSASLHPVEEWDAAKRRQAGVKLGHVTKACILVGLNPCGPGWLLLDATSHRKISCSDVVFQEQVPFFLRPTCGADAQVTRVQFEDSTSNGRPFAQVPEPCEPSESAAPASSIQREASLRVHPGIEDETSQSTSDVSTSSSSSSASSQEAPDPPSLSRRISRPPPFYDPVEGKWTQGPSGPPLDNGSLQPLSRPLPQTPEEPS